MERINGEEFDVVQGNPELEGARGRKAAVNEDYIPPYKPTHSKQESMDATLNKTDSTIIQDSDKAGKKDKSGSSSHRSSGFSIGHTLKSIVKAGTGHNSKHRATVDSKSGSVLSADKQSEFEPNPARSSQSHHSGARSTRSRPNGGNAYINGNTTSLINYIVDTIDAMTDQICQRVPSIPITIRAFCKAIYDQNKSDRAQANKLIASYIVEKWLSRVAFQDMVVYGLKKTYYIQGNAYQNLKLMGHIMNKIFRMDETPYQDEVMHQFNKLYLMKKNKIKEFYRELIDITEFDEITIENIFKEQSEQKFVHHSMCLNLPTVNGIYNFFKKYKG